MEMLGLIGILAALVCLILLIMKGVDLFIAVFVSVIIVCATNMLSPYQAIMTKYMPTFSNFIASYFMIYVTGSILGKLMEVTGGSTAIARIISKVNARAAYVFVPIVAGIMTYGGVQCFVVILALVPIANAIFKDANLPRRFVPASLYFGCCTFAMVAPGTVQIQNVIPANAFGQPYTCGLVVGMVTCFFTMIVGTLWLKSMIDRAAAQGEHWIDRDNDVFFDETKQLPDGFITLIPLLVIVIAINIRVNGANLIPIEAGMVLGIAVMLFLLRKFIQFDKLAGHIADAVKNALLMIFSVATVTGFGGVIRSVDVFPKLVDLVISIPGPALVSAAISTTVLAAICGSASGGLGIVTPVLSPIYLAQNVTSHAAISRVMSIAASALDSIPHSGTVCTTIRGFCGETHQTAYKPIFWLSVFLPAVQTALAVVLFMLFPTLP